MKVLLFGHSYVHYLRRLGNWNRCVKLQSGEEVELEFVFHSRPGKDYWFFNNNPEEFDRISNEKPDILVCVLGGNSIVESVSDDQLRLEAQEFYGNVRKVAGPSCRILAAQVEPRYAEEGNKFGTPQLELFNKRRQLINNYINKTLRKSRKLVNNMIMLGSINFFNEEKFKADGVHLNDEGLNMYKECILNTILYSLKVSQ